MATATYFISKGKKDLGKKIKFLIPAQWSRSTSEQTPDMSYYIMCLPGAWATGIEDIILFQRHRRGKPLAADGCKPLTGELV